MIGNVDGSGRALLVLNVRPSDEDKTTELTVWIDTGFTGDLVIPGRMIRSLGLSPSSAVLALLADGTEVVMDSFSCLIECFGKERLVEVIENDGDYPLLGVGLLRNRKLTVDYLAQSLPIE